MELEDTQPFRRDWKAVLPPPEINKADCSRWVGIDPEPLEFTIADLVPEGMATLLVSEGGAGKSMLMQTACTCVPTGLKFFGKVTSSGSTAGVFAEDPESVLHLRQTRINAALGVDMEALAGRAFVQSYSGMDATLWQDGSPTTFFQDLELQLGKIEELRLLTLDNSALIYAGDESGRLEVTRFLNALNGMAQRLSIGVILSTHASKSTDGSTLRAASGSTAWINACRSVLQLKAGPEDDKATLKLIKSNHSKPGQEIPLEWRDGVLVAQHEDSAFIASMKRQSAERVFLSLLAKITVEGRTMSASLNAGNYAPKIFAKRPEREGFGFREFESAMERLFAAQSIRVEERGRPGDRRSRIVSVHATTDDDDVTL